MYIILIQLIQIQEQKYQIQHLIIIIEDQNISDRNYGINREQLFMLIMWIILIIIIIIILGIPIRHNRLVPIFLVDHILPGIATHRRLLQELKEMFIEYLITRVVMEIMCIDITIMLKICLICQNNKSGM